MASPQTRSGGYQRARNSWVKGYNVNLTYYELIEVCSLIKRHLALWVLDVSERLGRMIVRPDASVTFTDAETRRGLHEGFLESKTFVSKNPKTVCILEQPQQS